MQRVKKEHKFWHDKFQNIIKGMADSEFEERLVQFVQELDYLDISEAEKEMIFSKELGMHSMGRVLKKNVERFLE